MKNARGFFLCISTLVLSTSVNASITIINQTEDFIIEGAKLSNPTIKVLDEAHEIISKYKRKISCTAPDDQCNIYIDEVNEAKHLLVERLNPGQSATIDLPEDEIYFNSPDESLTTTYFWSKLPIQISVREDNGDEDDDYGDFGFEFPTFQFKIASKCQFFKHMAHEFKKLSNHRDSLSIRPVDNHVYALKEVRGKLVIKDITGLEQKNNANAKENSSAPQNSDTKIEVDDANNPDDEDLDDDEDDEEDDKN